MGRFKKSGIFNIQDFFVFCYPVGGLLVTFSSYFVSPFHLSPSHIFALPLFGLFCSAVITSYRNRSSVIDLRHVGYYAQKIPGALAGRFSAVRKTANRFRTIGGSIGTIRRNVETTRKKLRPTPR